MTPAAVLLDQLTDARRAGRTFAEAWPSAYADALAAAPSRGERSEWADVLGGMVTAWRAAWDRRPPSQPELALRAVAVDPERVPCAGERLCECCGKPIPPGRCARAIYCSDRCKHTAYHERRLAQVA